MSSNDENTYEINYFDKSRDYVPRLIQKYKNTDIFDKKLQQIVWDTIFHAQARAEKSFPKYASGSKERFDLFQKHEFLFFLRYLFWRQKGRNIFDFSAPLIEMLNNTDVEEIEFQQIKLPYKSFYLHLGHGNLLLYLDELGNEVYANGALITQAKEKELDIFYLGVIKDKSVYKIRKWYQFPEYKSGFTLVFAEQNTKIESSLEEFRKRIEKTYDADGVSERLELTTSNLKLIVNCISYLTVDNADIVEEQSKDTPKHLIEKLENAKSNHKKQIVQAELIEQGYTKINYCGNKYKSDKEVAELLQSGIKPHWRRGFYRNQVFGEGNKSRKRIWIEPTIVNKSLGEPAKGHIYDIRKTD